MNLYYNEHNNVYRVWRENWSNDQFEILDDKEFHRLEDVCSMFSINLILHEED